MKFITIGLLSLVLSVNLSAQKSSLTVTDGPWQKLSEVAVEVDGSAAEIPIFEKEKYGSLHFRVSQAKLTLLNVEIYYDNGDKQDVVLNQTLDENKKSRIIDLLGDRRVLTRVVFRFKSVPLTDDKKAQVQLWASKATGKPVIVKQRSKRK